MMKKTIFTFLLGAVCLFIYSSGMAQKASKNFSFGFGLEGGIPTGDANDFYNFSGGLTLRLSYHVGPGFATLTSGGIAFIPKSFEDEDSKAGLLIPVKAGYKYIFAEHFFVMGELGYGSFKQYFADEDGDLQSVTNSGFIYAPAIGVQFGVAELSLRYESLKVKDDNLSYLGLRIGFNF